MIRFRTVDLVAAADAAIYVGGLFHGYSDD
jgi:hypothetical protein